MIQINHGSGWFTTHIHLQSRSVGVGASVTTGQLIGYVGRTAGRNPHRHALRGDQYVYCRVWGPIVQVGSAFNHWWLKTDLDEGNPWQNQYVSACYLSRWGNDVARDNSGVDLPDC
ncbi:M23 family metallopeptidase [Nonomuraea sp. B12E4]|uniref:M23 family metallopeptidase n=1 Tax=Nonomuraea sp. B12E4 TaxID=3153564 RepID=UPI00325D6FC6